MSTTAIMLIASGVVLLCIELLLLPGFTLPGALGVLLMIAGVVWAGWSAQSLVVAGLYLAVTAGITVPLVLVGLWLIPRTRIGQRIILQAAEQKESGFQAPSKSLEQLVGKRGTALTPLRPAGTALIEGRQVDVVTEGRFIERNTPIQVILVEGNRVVVSHAEEE